MKITKEKVVYFLSLNFVSFIFLLPVFLITLGDGCFICEEIVDSCFFCKLSFYFDILIISFIFSLIAFFNVFLKRQKYGFFKISFLISIYSAIFAIFVNLDLVGLFYLFDKLEIILFLTFLFLISFVFNLITLKITDPLRRKIKW